MRGRAAEEKRGEGREVVLVGSSSCGGRKKQTKEIQEMKKKEKTRWMNENKEWKKRK